ncbi:MAG: amidophosphoribosyltransferase, partial [Desulfovermiculus sp.]
CYYGIDFSSKGELIAANHSVSDIAKYIGLDSLHFLSSEGLRQAVGGEQDYCMACFEGDYPVLPGANYGKMCFDS